jgi:hypothetical protein
MLPIPIKRIYQPYRSWLQLTAISENRSIDSTATTATTIRFPEIRFIGNNNSNQYGKNKNNNPWCCRGEEPTIKVDGEYMSFSEFETVFKIFKKYKGDFSWTGVTIISFDMVPKYKRDDDTNNDENFFLDGPLNVTLKWRLLDVGIEKEVVIETTYGKLM